MAYNYKNHLINCFAMKTWTSIVPTLLDDRVVNSVEWPLGTEIAHVGGKPSPIQRF